LNLLLNAAALLLVSGCDEMFLMSKGSLEVTIAGRTTSIDPVSAAYVHSGVEHGVRNPGAVDAQYFVVAAGTES
jgi:mannose-6-phosphate isomerase-like protein (cupin superfamily)